MKLDPNFCPYLTESMAICIINRMKREVFGLLKIDKLNHTT